MRPSRRNQEKGSYATGVDFRRIFATEMDGLYQLAYLLTVDPAKAEQAFVAGLDDSLKSNYVFKRWAYSWAKRVVIQNAIRLTLPRPTDSLLHTALTFSEEAKNETSDSKKHFDLKSVLSLAPFERFVFVLTALEHHSDHECALLLSCLVPQIRYARSKALEQLANSDRTGKSSAELKEDLDPAPQDGVVR
jgi:DNA-directed RNA polymerase specialized sigma24 family protein